MPTKIEKDAFSGTDTTGHEWDGLKELNTPLPKWWLFIFGACIVYAAVIFVLYPSIPYGVGYWHGLLGYSSRVSAMAGVREMQDRHGPAMEKIGALSFADIKADPALTQVALTAGRIAFANNCQPCHGQNGEGHIGYPALGDDVWLWGGKIEQIHQTIQHGTRNADPDSHNSVMPSFGADAILTPPQIQQVADFVMTLYGETDKPGPGVAAGKALFAENCAVCHGDNGQGNQDVGAPPLASRIHLYGSDRATVVGQITKPHLGQMPNWSERLDPPTIKSLAIFVHSLGGGQ